MSKISLVPRDPQKIERELGLLSRVLVHLDSGETDYIHRAIALAFLANFEEESSGGFPWRSLAPRTQAERMQEGHDPHHPILVREGDYKESWVNVLHPLHIAEHGSFAGMTVFVEGSKDPRVPTLSGGDWLLNVPARPVEELDEEMVEDVILPVIFEIIEDKADKVPDSPIGADIF